MTKTSHPGMIHRILFFWLLILTSACSTEHHEKDYLLEVSNNLSKIKSATYFSTVTASAPGDTAKFSAPNTQYVKIFINPSDTLVGSSSLLYAESDTTKITSFYDGKVRGRFNWDEKYVKVDSFQNHPYPFRLVHYPFYTKINEILRYSLTTEDSIKTNFRDYGDSIHFRLKIYNKHVYFHIKPLVIKNDYIFEDEISQFDIWIRKTDNLPYRMRSKWHHTTVFEECANARFNTANEVLFRSVDYFPEDFEVIQFTRETRKAENSLEGKRAPDWVLQDLDSNAVRLEDIKSKVVMIQFTGIGCGPCHQSLPFLNQLVEEHRDKDFEFISIETWSDNIDGMIRYRDKNGMNYKFLKADDSIKKDYGISSVPVFFILDKDRIVRKVINGYSKTSSDTSIIKTIDAWL